MSAGCSWSYPGGGKWWRLKYRFDNKEKLLSLGVYPDVGLKEARDRRDEARKLLAAGIDPGAHRKAHKSARADRAANSFEVVAREWFAKYSASWAENHGNRIIRRFERDIFPWIGGRPIAEVTAPELLAVVRRIESRGALASVLLSSGPNAVPIRPISLRAPVAVTLAAPCPATTRVPEETNGVSSPPGRAAADSPAWPDLVDRHRFAGQQRFVDRACWPLTIIASAGTRSPSAIMTRSPRAISRAAMRRARHRGSPVRADW